MKKSDKYKRKESADKTSINYVINPLAPDVGKLKVTTYPLQLDHRLIRY